MTLSHLLIGAVLLVPGVARAAEPEPPASDAPPGAPALTPDEQKAIEDSLGAPSEPVTPEPAVTVPSFVQSMNPDLSLIFDTALGWFSDDDPEELGDHDPRRTGFTLQQLELHASASVDPFFRLDANLVFGEDGVEVEEAFATTTALPAGLQLRAGRFLARFGKRNGTHPHQWSFLDQPLVLGKFFGSDGGAGLGLEVSWLAPLPWYVELVGSAQGATGECCARSFYGDSDPSIHALDDFVYLIALKQFFDLSDDWALQWGLSAELGANSSARGNRTAIYGTDLFLRWKPTRGEAHRSVDLLVELLARTRQVPGDLLVDWGGFAELRWQLDAQWAIAARHELVTGLDDDPLDADWTGNRQRTALAIDFMPSHFGRLRLQGGADVQGWKSGADQVGGFVMLGLEVGIGAHGAHAY